MYILDIGPGPRSALESITFSPNVQLFATEPLANEYHKFGRYEMDSYRTTYYTFPAETLAMVPRDVPYFDAILCTNALDHARDPQKVCQEIKRVLKPSGLFFLQICLDNAEYNRHEAHKINLNPTLITEWLGDDFETIRMRWHEYSWNFQPSCCMVFKKN